VTHAKGRHYILTDEVRQHVVATACLLWDEFLTFKQGEFTADSLFLSINERTTREHNHCAVEFFRFCAQVVHGIPDAAVVNQSLDGVVESRRGIPSSWLWNMNTRSGKNYPLITIDRESILRQVQQEFHGLRGIHRLYTMLILHETGHLVLHWKYLNANVLHHTNDGRQAFDAKAEHEAEAWWFCFSVVAQASGAIASIARRGDPENHDPLWYYLLC